MKPLLPQTRAARGPRAKSRKVAGRRYDGRHAMRLKAAMEELGAVLAELGVGEIEIPVDEEQGDIIDAELAAHPIVKRLVTYALDPPHIAYGGVRFVWKPRGGA